MFLFFLAAIMYTVLQIVTSLQAVAVLEDIDLLAVVVRSPWHGRQQHPYRIAYPTRMQDGCALALGLGIAAGMAST